MALALSRARRQRASQAPRAQRAGTSSFPSAWERQLRLSTQPRSFSQPRNLGVVLREVCEMALVLEYIIVGVLVATNLSVGLYFSFRKANVGPGSKVTATEVFLGGRMLKTFPLAASSVVSLFSSTGLIGLPAHYYAYGWHMTWSFLTPLFCIPFGTHVFMPVLYRLRITSIFESIVGASSVFAASLALVTVPYYGVQWHDCTFCRFMPTGRPIPVRSGKGCRGGNNRYGCVSTVTHRKHTTEWKKPSQNGDIPGLLLPQRQWHFFAIKHYLRYSTGRGKRLVYPVPCVLPLEQLLCYFRYSFAGSNRERCDRRIQNQRRPISVVLELCGEILGKVNILIASEIGKGKQGSIFRHCYTELRNRRRSVAFAK
ncbi:uncharacterized protein [Dermacentor albipictus]|uniref:uncharacterized protein isoform X10 n=1 Tax=Dermacentor albipictus TaxID=60249 RepID=UPI0031FC0A32